MNALQEKYLEIFSSIDFEHVIDHPNILIAASFWDEKRYGAARVFYKFMRMIDDLIDDHRSVHKIISRNERQQFTDNVNNWLKIIIDGEKGNNEEAELTETFKKFRIPSWPLESFARAMIYDINNDGFPTFNSFLEYAGGASIAPAAIFVHLAGLRELENKYSAPLFNVREAATCCAIFSYLVHIMRDFQKDQLNNLNYFADDLIEKHKLTRADLLEFARGKKPTDKFRDLMSEYYDIADESRKKTYDCIRAIWPYLEPRYQLSLEIVFELYLMVFERIDPRNGSFSTTELNPTPDEIKQRVYNTILNSRTIVA